MKDNQRIHTIVMVISCIFIAIALIGCIYLTFIAQVDSTFLKVSGFIALVGLFASFFYARLGGGKQEAIFFKLFVYLFAASEMTSVLGSVESGLLSTGLNALCFALVLTMALSENLGKKKSLTLSGIVFVYRLYCMIRLLPALFSLDLTAIRALSELAMALVLFCCTYTKYLDKAARGRA